MSDERRRLPEDVDARELAYQIEAFVEQTSLTSAEFEDLHKAWAVVESHAAGDDDE